MEKTMEIYQNNWSFWTYSVYKALELLFAMEKLCYYGKNNGTMEKTMVLWKKQWYYGKNYGTILNYSIFLLGLVEIGLVILEKKTKMWKFTTTTTDNGQISIRKANLCFQLRRSKRSSRAT